MKNFNSFIKGVCCTFLIISTTVISSEWEDITTNFEISNTRPVYDRVNRQMNVYVTLKNVSKITYASRFRFLASQPNLTIMNNDFVADGSAGFNLSNVAIKPSTEITFKIAYSRSRSYLSYVPVIEQKIIAVDGVSTHEEVVTVNDGGILSLSEGVTLIVPTGAVNESKLLSLNIKEGDTDDSKHIILGPNGTTFEKPVGVLVKTENPIDDYEFYFYSDSHEAIEDNGQLIKVRPLSITKIDEYSAIVEIEHFSIVTVNFTPSLYTVFALPYKYLQKGDLIYSISEIPIGEDYSGLRGWFTGHGAIYGGEEKDINGNSSSMIIESSHGLNGISCKNQEIVSSGVRARCDGDAFYDWYTRFDNRNFYVGAKRYKSISSAKQEQVVNSALSYDDRAYELVGEDDNGGMSCVGLIEQAYSDNGLNLTYADDLPIYVNFITPIDQYNSLNLEGVNEITVEVGDELSIPIYGFSKQPYTSIGAVLNITTLEPYAPTKVQSYLPNGIIWVGARCSGIEIEGDTCARYNFDSGSIFGIVPSSASGNSYYATFEVKDWLGRSEQKTLHINVKAEANIFTYSQLWGSGTTFTSDEDDTVIVNGIILESTLDTMDGSDDISVGDKLLRGKILSGDGDNIINIAKEAYDSTITSGSGKDQVIIGTGATRVTLNTGSNDDHIIIKGQLYEGSTKSGSGDDILEIGSTSLIRGNIDMGSGDDILVLTGNRSSYTINESNGVFIIGQYHQTRAYNVEAIVFGDGYIMGDRGLGLSYKN
ncbi:MAG: hypothetical protein QM500_06095 [Methylococcales bacterium]